MTLVRFHGDDVMPHGGRHEAIHTDVGADVDDAQIGVGVEHVLEGGTDDVRLPQARVANVTRDERVLGVGVQTHGRAGAHRQPHAVELAGDRRAHVVRVDGDDVDGRPRAPADGRGASVQQLHDLPLPDRPRRVVHAPPPRDVNDDRWRCVFLFVAPSGGRLREARGETICGIKCSVAVWF